MKYNYFQKFIKWLLCGVIISVLINGIYIITLFINFPSICYYIVPLPIATVVCLMLKEDKVSWLFLATGIMLLGNFTTEILLQISALTNYFYYSIYPNATEVALGEGIKLIYLYGVSTLGVIIGWIMLFINTISNFRKINKQQ